MPSWWTWDNWFFTQHASTTLEVVLPYNDGYTVMYMLLDNPQCPLGHLRDGEHLAAQP